VENLGKMNQDTMLLGHRAIPNTSMKLVQAREEAKSDTASSLKGIGRMWEENRDKSGWNWWRTDYSNGLPHGVN